MIPTLLVNLNLPPEERWKLTPQQIEWAQMLVNTTLNEIGGVEPYRELIELYSAEHIPETFAAEIHSLSGLCSRTNLEILTANLYYDFVKLLLGCTAFSVNTPNGPIHARNMDWFSESNCLSDYTTIISFQGRESFQSVGWPGFAGMFSGIAPGRFAITMNAALSNEPQVPGASIAILIREVFETCSDFSSAVEKLCNTTITSDCLLLITGCLADEMLVIERTPTRFALRHHQDGHLVLTNDFHVLPQATPSVDSPLYNSTCSRFRATMNQLHAGHPASVEDCFAILGHENVRMSITVQQMVMTARSGELHVRTGKYPKNTMP
ncbi:MAG: hypothetical protein KDA78_13010 [Planctomycetaceae bacterium]|nr:hypothetical protein [Planctomycetaceae bacterium]